MRKRRPCSGHIALVGILVLALLVPAAAIAAGKSKIAPAAAISKKKCSKIKNKKKRKKCKKKQAGSQAAGLAGSWTGTVSGGVSATLSFTVSAGDASVDNFAVTVLPVYCFGEGFVNRVFLIPSTPLSGGAFATVLQTTNDSGQVDGRFEASGTLTNTTGSGALRYERAGCSSGPLTWTATHA
ncbi:MAG: hypothetical protein ACXWDT_01495 [Solirubrobacterales bacterium]